MTELMIEEDTRLAEQFVAERVRNFKRLHLTVKKILLQVVEYYLSIYYPGDAEANSICEAIQANPSESRMVETYTQFLNFLPVRLRSGIQGRYLFRQPSIEEQMLNNAKEQNRIEARPLGVEDKLINMMESLTQGELDIEKALHELERLELV